MTRSISGLLEQRWESHGRGQALLLWTEAASVAENAISLLTLVVTPPSCRPARAHRLRPSSTCNIPLRPKTIL